ncbi:MAG: hypothetical protein NTX25_01445, partial [Proteobacteria bacterium]|nr:hypothetical protein [Pseudomonadota bacterium]
MDQAVLRPSLLPQYLLWLFTAALGLDIPAARAYNEHPAWTKYLGAYLFHGVKEMYLIPLPFTLFEILSYSAAGLILVRWGSQRARLWTCAFAMALLVPLVCAFATFTGFLRGNLLSMAFSQLHFVPMLSCWLLIGFYLGAHRGILPKAARIIFWVCVWRSCYALYVFFVIYHGNMGTREYLIDHASSIFFVAGMCYALFQTYMQRHQIGRMLGYLASFFLMLGPYVLNDRRASFLGVIVALMLVPWIVPSHFRKRMMPGYLCLAGAGIFWIIVKIAFNHDPNSLAGALQGAAGKSFQQLDYRKIENYNLMLGVIERPLLGLGFGTRFPQAVQLPDISFSFELFDAIPHNTFLFLWTFAGPLGVAALTTLATLLLLIIARVGRLARFPNELMLATLGLLSV